MEGHEYEKLLRTALKDPKGRYLEVGYDGLETTVWFMVKVNGKTARGYGEAHCDPNDTYSSQVGYELAFDRAINDCVVHYIEQRNEEREKNDKRRAEWEAQTEEDLLDRISDVFAAMAQPVYTYFDNAAAFVPWEITPPEAPKPTRVRITKQPASRESWYRDKVGEEFNVYEWKSPTTWCLSLGDIDGRIIHKSDCEVVTTPPTPQRKRAVKATSSMLWCDDSLVGAIRAIAGVTYVGQPNEHTGSRKLFISPLYDEAEVIAAIEAVGRE